MCKRERRLESNRKLKEWYKVHGWCVDCGAPAAEGRVLCAECAAKRREYMREYWENGRRKKKKA